MRVGCRKTLRCRWEVVFLAGSWQQFYPCDTVADDVHIVPRCETRRQVRILLGQLRAVRQIIFVVCDNACVLAQHLRAHHRHQRTASEQLAHLTSVLDRWHKRNHTGCSDPTSAQHDPEVDIDEYLDLQGLNMEANEKFTSWIGKLASDGSRCSFCC